jgi:ATP-binding cassette subfamily B protein
MVHEEEVLGKAYDARLMRRLLGYLRPYRRQVVIASVAIVSHSLIELAPPLLTKLVIDRYIPEGDIAGVSRVAALYLAVLLGSFALEYLQTWTMQMTGQRIMFDLRQQIYGHLHRLDVRFYDRNPVGRLMTRVTTDVDALNELFTAGVVSVFGDLVTLVGIMAVLVWMDWRLALVAFSVLPLVALIAHWFRTRVRQSYRNVRTLIARINAFLQERLTGMSTVQLFRREARDFAEFDAIDRAHRDANVQSIFYYAVFYPAVELVSALAAALIIWRGGGWMMEGTLTLGALVAFFQYSQRFFRPISHPWTDSADSATPEAGPGWFAPGLRPTRHPIVPRCPASTSPAPSTGSRESVRRLPAAMRFRPSPKAPPGPARPPAFALPRSSGPFVREAVGFLRRGPRRSRPS